MVVNCLDCGALLFELGYRSDTRFATTQFTAKSSHVVETPTSTGSIPVRGNQERSLLSESLVVLVSQMSIFGLVEFDTLLIGRYCDDSQAGAWGAIRRLITVVSAPLLLVNAALPGFIAELHSQGEKIKLEKILRAASTLATPPAIVAFVGLFYFAFGGRVFGVAPWVVELASISYAFLDAFPAHDLILVSNDCRNGFDEELLRQLQEIIKHPHIRFQSFDSVENVVSAGIRHRKMRNQRLYAPTDSCAHSSCSGCRIRTKQQSKAVGYSGWLRPH